MTTTRATATATGQRATSCKAPTGDGPKVGLAYDVGGRGDQSFNDSAYAGLEKAVEELDATCTEGEAADGEAESAREERLRTHGRRRLQPDHRRRLRLQRRRSTRSLRTTRTSTSRVIDGFDPDAEANDNVAYLGFAEQRGLLPRRRRGCAEDRGRPHRLRRRRAQRPDQEVRGRLRRRCEGGQPRHQDRRSSTSRRADLKRLRRPGRWQGSGRGAMYDERRGHRLPRLRWFGCGCLRGRGRGRRGQVGHRCRLRPVPDRSGRRRRRTS